MLRECRNGNCNRRFHDRCHHPYPTQPHRRTPSGELAAAAVWFCSYCRVYRESEIEAQISRGDALRLGHSCQRMSTLRQNALLERADNFRTRPPADDVETLESEAARDERANRRGDENEEWIPAGPVQQEENVGEDESEDEGEDEEVDDDDDDDDDEHGDENSDEVGDEDDGDEDDEDDEDDDEVMARNLREDQTASRNERANRRNNR